MDKELILQKQQEFIRNFVSAVYGILLGFGFSNAIWEIYDEFKDKNQDAFLFDSFIETPFSYAIILFAIIVLCVHWWDWRLGVVKYVSPNIVEFIINILILLNIEWLFFEYNNFINLSLLMATLALLNFVWVLNFRIQRYAESGLKFKKYIFQRIVLEHIFKRFLGVILYTVLFIIFYNINQKALPDQGIYTLFGLLLLFALFLFDRIILYKNRKIKIGNKEEEF